MLKSEQTQEGFKKILEAVPGEGWLKLHGSYRYPVYEDWKSEPQNNTDLHILYVWGGEGTYHMADGTEIRLYKGTLTFISHGVLHHATVNRQNPLRIAGLRFGIYDSSGRDVTREIAGSFYHSFWTKDFLPYDEKTWKIHQLFHKKKDSVSLKLCSMLLYELLYDFHQSTSVNSNETYGNKKLEKIRQAIEEHPYEKISIEGLAKEVGMSVRYLQKCFKKTYWFTLKEYHLNVQMNMAYTLLTQGSVSVTRLAELLGYSDVFAFSKQFKKHFGYPPTGVLRK